MNKLIEIKNLFVRYDNVVALKDISLDICEGDYIGIIGPNGGGKSTLIKTILGYNKDYSGTIKLKENLLTSYVPQRSEVSRDFPITVLEVVLTALLPSGFHPFFRYKETDKNKAFEILKELKIENLAERSINELSGGEFQRMLIARALVSKPKLLFLDEPTSNVDPNSRSIIYEILRKLNLEGVTILLVTHDVMAISSFVKSVACMNTSLVYHGDPEISSETINKMYGCPIDLIAHGVPHRVFKENVSSGGTKS